MIYTSIQKTTGIPLTILQGSSITPPEDTTEITWVDSAPPDTGYNWDFATSTWIINPLNSEQLLELKWQEVKLERDKLLQNSDWRVIKAVDTGVPLDTAWKVYRQALRDITFQVDPFNIVWPEPPTV